MIEDLGVLLKGSFCKVSYYSVFFLLVETELIWSASVETGAIQRGVYLRETHDCQRASEWAVEVKPKFHEDADKLDVHVLFEENVRLETGGHSWIKCPEYLLLTYNGRKFKYFLLPEPTYGKIIYSHNWCQGTTMTPEC
jgi:hypothetical protein